MSEEKNKTVKLSFTDTWECYINLPKEVYEKEYKDKISNLIENGKPYELKEIIEEIEKREDSSYEEWEHGEPHFHGATVR